MRFNAAGERVAGLQLPRRTRLEAREHAHVDGRHEGLLLRWPRLRLHAPLARAAALDEEPAAAATESRRPRLFESTLRAAAIAPEVPPLVDAISEARRRAVADTATTMIPAPRS